MNKKPKLTQEKKFLMKLYAKKPLTEKTLTIYIQQIKNNKITMSDISYFERKFFEIFTIDNTLEFFATCEEEKKKLKQELNEI